MRDTKSSVIKGQRDFIIVPLSFMINFSLVILQRSFQLSGKSHWVKFQFHYVTEEVIAMIFKVDVA